MEVRFYIDSATSGPHIWRHGVREEEVEEVLLQARIASEETAQESASGVLPLEDIGSEQRHAPEALCQAPAKQGP